MPGTLEDAATGISRLISIFRDAEQGYRAAANAAREPSLRDMLLSYASQHGEFAVRLEHAVKVFVGRAIPPSGPGGTEFGWARLKSLVSAHDEHAILVEAERGEEWVRDICRDVLAKTPPGEVRSVIEIQCAEIEQTCSSLQVRRDATAPRQYRA